MGSVRQPKKVNAIEKKERIIKAGLDAFTKKGYYNTTTVEIAKIAKVSTGIVYSYFKDKKDIFLHSIDLYFDKLYSPLINKLGQITVKDLKSSIREIVNLTIESHKKNAASHEEFVAMSHLDASVRERFMVAEHHLTEYIEEALKKINPRISNANEKAHLSYNLIESLCHEYVFHKHNFIDYTETINETIDLIAYLIQK